MTLNVSYACNDGYIMQTGISLISLFENNRHFDEITLYMISCGISQDNLNIIESICNQYDRKVKVINFKDIAYDLNISAIGRHIETIYAKIFFERIENVDRIIYIDSDTIVTGKLDGMWQADLTDSYMGMVETFTGRREKPKLGIPSDSPFYNDGMAIVNVSYCREHLLIEKCKKVIEQYYGNPPVLSEGVLNKVCLGHIFTLSPRYNMMAGLYQMIGRDVKYTADRVNYSLDELLDSYQNPVIIHFLAGFYNRPWTKHCTHPLRGEFIKYKMISPWKDYPLSDTKLPMRLRAIGLLMDVLGPRKLDKMRRLLNKF